MTLKKEEKKLRFAFNFSVTKQVSLYKKYKSAQNNNNSGTKQMKFLHFPAITAVRNKIRPFTTIDHCFKFNNDKYARIESLYLLPSACGK